MFSMSPTLNKPEVKPKLDIYEFGAMLSDVDDGLRDLFALIKSQMHSPTHPLNLMIKKF